MVSSSLSQAFYAPPPLLKTPHIPPVDLSDLVKNTGTMKLRAFFIVVINHTVALVIVFCYLFLFIRNEIKDIRMTKHIFGTLPIVPI